MTQNRSIPQNAITIAAPDSSAVAYLESIAGKFHAKGYRGKRNSCPQGTASTFARFGREPSISDNSSRLTAADCSGQSLTLHQHIGSHKTPAAPKQ